jgi:glycosyltransferase involved in cell wall biosynthesis
MDNVPQYLISGVKPIVVGLFGRRDLAIFSRANAIAMSEHLLKELRETTGIRFETRPTIIPGWVDTTSVVQRETYLESGLLRLVALGALGAHKGTDVILDACERLVAGGHTAFRVDVYGFGEIAPWVGRAAQQGVSGYVRFLGPRSQPEVMALLPCYDAFLFPTWEREPFGFTPIEAAACGVVPIITRNAGVAERLVDKVHTVKIDRDAESLAAAILSLMTGEGDVEAIGRRAARMVRSDLSFARCLDSIERVLATADCRWDKSALDRSRLTALLYAKDALGQHLTAHT